MKFAIRILEYPIQKHKKSQMELHKDFQICKFANAIEEKKILSIISLLNLLQSGPIAQLVRAPDS